jgi:hypothetical protein
MVVEKESHPEVVIKKPAKKGFWEEPKTRRDFLKWSIRAGAGLATLAGGWGALSLLRKKEKQPLSALVPGKPHLPLSPEKPPVETPPPVVEETPEEITEEIKEFTPDMIKNRLYLMGEELPMWYVREWVEYEEVVSAVVAGPVKFNQGELKEIFVPVAFQNPTTKEFFIRDLSIGASGSPWSEFGIVDLTSWQFLTERSSYRAYIIDQQRLIERLYIGDQIAFTLVISLENEIERGIPPECLEDPYCNKLIEEMAPNNKAIFEAMQKNKDLPEVIIFPNMFFINKEKE